MMTSNSWLQVTLAYRVPACNEQRSRMSDRAAGRQSSAMLKCVATMPTCVATMNLPRDCQCVPAPECRDSWRLLCIGCRLLKQLILWWWTEACNKAHCAATSLGLVAHFGCLSQFQCLGPDCHLMCDVRSSHMSTGARQAPGPNAERQTLL